ncbi:MAG: type II secretion system minor pseudopilin GspK, partial [Pseudomonadota bacterium]
DDLSETWAQEAAPYALGEGGWMMGRLTDLQGRFNLNRLADPAPERDDGEGPRFTPAQEQFIRLLQSLDNVPVDQQQAIAITESISDWLDVDANARLEGAEDSAYFAREPAYRAANAPMASVSELQAVANMTPEIYAALASLVTVWPTSPQPLNVHTAPLALLRSINADGVLEPLDLSDTQQLVEYRQLAGFADMDDFFLQAALDADALPGIRPLLGESSSWFMLAATVEVADRQMRLYSVLQRRGRSISASVRASGSL